MRSTTLLHAAAAAFLALVCAPVVVARDGDGDDAERVVNDQSQVFDRLSSLKKRMEHLIGRLEQEGQARKVELVKKALAEIDTRSLESRRDEVLRLLSAQKGSLQSHDKQEQLLTDLEAILELLRDEPKLSDLEKKVDELHKALASLRDLRNAERTLREKTEQTAGNEARTFDQLAQLLSELLGKQQTLTNDTSKDAADANAEQKRAQLAAQKALEKKVESLAAAQKKVVDDLESQASERTGDAPTAVDLAEKAAKRGDAESLKEAAKRVSDQRTELGDKDPKLEAALRQLEKQLGDAALDAAKTPEATLPDASKPALDESIAQTKKAVEQALRSPTPDAKLADAAKQEGELAPQAHEAQQQANDAAAKSLDEAAKQLDQAKTGLEKQDLGQGLSQAKEALAKLEEAKEALAQQNARSEQQQKSLAARQDFLRSQADDAKKSASALAKKPEEQDGAPSSPQNASKNSQLEQTKQALDSALTRASGAMKQSKQSLEKGDAKDAQPQQKESEEALKDALAQAKQASQQAQQDAQKDPAAAQQENKKLADEQREIEEKLRDLMQRLRDQQQKNGQEQGQAAQRSMDRARQSLEQNEPDPATQSEKEAEKNLEEMQKKLAEEQNLYESLRSEEMLFRLKERLTELRRRSAALHDGIAQLDVDRAGTEKLSRRLRPRVQQLGEEAGAIAKDNGEVRGKLAEQSATFPWVLDKNGADLGALQERLSNRDPETGEFVQVLADDVVTRYDRLLQSLDEEMKRRQQAQQDQKNGQQQQGSGGQQKPQLVPPVAELLLLKRLEEDVKQDVHSMLVEQRDRSDSEAMEQRLRLMERLGHRHSELTNVFETLVHQQTQQPDEGDDEKKGDEAKPDGGKPEGEGAPKGEENNEKKNDEKKHDGGR